MLVISQSIADEPESIVRRLIGIDDARERQAQELHAIVGVYAEDQRWNARIARSVQKGVDKLSGEAVGTVINYDKITVEKGGSFDDLFAKQQATLTLKGYTPFDIELYGIDEAIELTGDLTDSLVLFVSILNENAAYQGELYFTESGALYSCIVEN